MDQQEMQQETGRRFGTYLRRVREGRRLSLDAVEELSSGHPERVTKSHLSRIENGQAVPSFSRLVTLSRIYGVPVASMAERFEVSLRRGGEPEGIAERATEDVVAEANQLRASGRHLEALARYEALLERYETAPRDASVVQAILDLRLQRVNCLAYLGCHGLAKDECEEVLGHHDLRPDRKLLALESYVLACVNLGRLAIAMMALDQVEEKIGLPETPRRIGADLAAIRAYILVRNEDFTAAATWYERAADYYAGVPDPVEACRCRINLGYVLTRTGERGRARDILEMGLREAETRGYDRHAALSLCNLALLCLDEGVLAAAEGFAIRSNSIARPREYVSFMFRNCFYLWKVARARGDEPGIRANERTLRTYLLRVEDDMPEVREFRGYLAGERS